jgi:hypothetical protein
MAEPDQFRRAPKRKAERAKTVSMSPEAKRAYEEMMRERDERDKNYTRHLPPESTRR